MSSIISTPVELETYPRPSRPWENERGGDETHNGIHTNPQAHETSGLEPTDGGPSAWKLLFATFAFEAILWGKYMQNPSLTPSN